MNTVSVEQAFSLIPAKATIVTAMAASEPQIFFENLLPHAKRADSWKLYCANPSQAYPCFSDANLSGRLEVAAMFLTTATRHLVGNGIVQYIPQHLSQWVEHLNQRTPGIDAFWGSCSAPDERGVVSLGLSAVYEPELIRSARHVILEINPSMPVTQGATTVPVDRVSAWIASNKVLPTIPSHQVDQVDIKIGGWIAELIPDGATIQLGIGAIPQAVGECLKAKKEIGIHTEMFNDAIVDLWNTGAVTNSRKSIWPGKMVGTFALGTQKLYEFCHRNSLIEFQPASVINELSHIARNYKMHSINTAVEIDLTGQCCSEAIGLRHLSGAGGAFDTHVGAQRSPGGRGIIAIRSVAKDGSSKIKSVLSHGAKVTISRNDIDTVVSEWGICELRGRSISERARGLIEIAHPDHRELLRAEAATAKYL